MKPYAVKPAHPEHGQRMFTLQVRELFFDQSASAVELAEPLGVACDAGEHPTTGRNGQGWLLASLYSFGRRFRPPRGTTYMNTIKATMITAAIATMETVDTATITRRSFPVLCSSKPFEFLQLEGDCTYFAKDPYY